MNAVIKLADYRRDEQEDVKVSEEGFVRVPNDLFDALLDADLSERQLRLMLAVIRKTIGFGKDADDVTISQLAKTANIARQNASPAFNDLVERGYVTANKGKHGFLVRLNTTQNWPRRTSRIETDALSQNETAVLNQDAQPSRIETHNRQPQQTITSLSSSAELDDMPSEQKPAAAKLQFPYERLLNLYHETCTSLPALRLVNDKRKQLLKTRWVQVSRDMKRYAVGDIEAGLAWWAKFFAAVEESNFLTGRAGDWHATYDWILKEANFAKIIDGNYENREQA